MVGRGLDGGVELTEWRGRCLDYVERGVGGGFSPTQRAKRVEFRMEQDLLKRGVGRSPAGGRTQTPPVSF